MIDDLALLAARLAVGGGIAAHGAQKAFGWFEGPGPEGAAGFFHQLGLRPGAQMAKFASTGEMTSGALIAAGLGGPIGPAMLMSTMLVAQLTVHAKNGFFAQKNGVELGVMYASAALALAANGFGALSLDRVFGLQRHLRHPVFTAVTIAGALAAGGYILSRREVDPPAPPDAAVAA